MAAFQHNPLSLSVPMEHVNDWARTTGVSPLHPSATPAAGHRRSRSGRSLAELTVDDLLKKRRPWREFAGGNRPLKSFSVPSSIEEASFKLTENVFEFIGNYLILGLVCVCCVLYKRPVALLGILVVSAAWEWQQRQQRSTGTQGNSGSTPTAVRRGSGGGGASVAPSSPRAGGTPSSPRGTPSGAPSTALVVRPAAHGAGPTRLQQLKQLLVTVFTWVVLMFSQVVPALALGALATLAAVCVHGVLRNPVPPMGRSRMFTSAR